MGYIALTVCVLLYQQLMLVERQSLSVAIKLVVEHKFLYTSPQQIVVCVVMDYHSNDMCKL